MLGNDQALVDQVEAAVGGDRRAGVAAAARARATASCSTATSPTCKNVGGPYGGAIIAALFLAEFVGDVPWAHLDIAGR